MHQSIESAQMLPNGDLDSRHASFALTFYRGEGPARRKMFTIEGITSRTNAAELKEIWEKGASMAAIVNYCKNKGVTI